MARFHFLLVALLVGATSVFAQRTQVGGTLYDLQTNNSLCRRVARSAVELLSIGAEADPGVLRRPLQPRALQEAQLWGPLRRERVDHQHPGGLQRGAIDLSVGAGADPGVLRLLLQHLYSARANGDQA